MYKLRLFAKKGANFLLAPKTVTIMPGVNIVHGSNGSGKTTMLNILCNNPLQADITLSEDALKFRSSIDSNAETLKTRLLIQSSTNLFVASTARRDLKLTAKLRPVSTAELLAKHFLAIWPDSSHILDAPAANISRGETQRYFFAIDAFSLANITGFDEVDTFCDDATVRIIREQLYQLHGKAVRESKYVLFATHFRHQFSGNSTYNQIDLGYRDLDALKKTKRLLTAKANSKISQFPAIHLAVSVTIPGTHQKIALDFDAEPNSTFLIFGNNGTGKTLLLKAIIRKYRRIYKIAFVPDWCADLGAGEIVGETFSKTSSYRRVLSQLGIDERKLTSDLSWGQRKAISILQALSREPRILLIDEPFAGLSSEVSLVLIEQLKRFLMRNRTLLITQNNSIYNEYSSRLNASKITVVSND